MLGQSFVALEMEWDKVTWMRNRRAKSSGRTEGSAAIGDRGLHSCLTLMEHISASLKVCNLEVCM